MEKFIKPIVIIISIIAILAIVSLLMLKYDVEGEQNMPFNLSRIMVISSAEGISKQDEENLWNMDIVQNNDIYLEIVKNEKYKKKEIIESIELNNYIIEENPLKGTLQLYKPSSNEENKLYNISEGNEVTEIIYTGSESTNIGNLEIANQGGRIQFRYVNKDLGKYISNDQGEIKHDGTILKKININFEELKAKVSFDITIKLSSGNKYKANIKLEFPTGNLVNDGTSTFEKTNMNDIIFKRI